MTQNQQQVFDVNPIAFINLSISLAFAFAVSTLFLWLARRSQDVTFGKLPNSRFDGPAVEAPMGIAGASAVLAAPHHNLAR